MDGILGFTAKFLKTLWTMWTKKAFIFGALSLLSLYRPRFFKNLAVNLRSLTRIKAISPPI